MDPVGLFVGFSNALGMGPFFLLILIYFLILLLPHAGKPIPFAVLVLLFSGIILHKISINTLFLTWTLELTVLMIVFFVFLKKPERDFSWFWVALGVIAFTW